MDARIIPNANMLTGSTDLSAIEEGFPPIGMSIPPQREAERTCEETDPLVRVKPSLFAIS